MLNYYYRPQRSWGKVLFSQVSVILFRGGVCGRGTCMGVCVAGGVCGREGHAWKGHVWWGACMAGGVCGRGMCTVGGMHRRGMCVVGGMHGRAPYHACPPYHAYPPTTHRGHAWQEACVASCHACPPATRVTLPCMPPAMHDPLPCMRACMVGGMHGGGCVAGGMCGRGACEVCMEASVYGRGHAW